MTSIMAKLQVQTFAKIPNKYVSIQRSRGLSLLEEKLAYMLINSMQKRYEGSKKLEQLDFHFIAHASITIDDFIDTMHIGSTNRKEISQALQNLILFALAIKTNTQDRFITMFSEFIVDYETNLIQYKFNDSFVTYFTGICTDFFKLSINEVIGLNSTHAIRIYQLLKTKLNMDNPDLTYTILKLKEFLSVEKKYSRYNNFKQFVLEISKQQINSSEASHFNIGYEEIKTGKAVTSIKFYIINKDKNYYQENNQLPKYKLDLLKKLCMKWKKEQDTNSIAHILSCKILEELKHKNPMLVVVQNYLDGIKHHVKDDLTKLNL